VSHPAVRDVQLLPCPDFIAPINTDYSVVQELFFNWLLLADILRTGSSIEGAW